MKILLIRLSSIGDIVLATSVLKPLRKRFPESEISMMVLSPFLPLLQGNPYLSRIIPFEAGQTFLSDLLNLIQFILALRRENFTLVIDLHRNFRSTLLMLFCRGEKKIGYSKEVWKRRAMVFFKKRWKGTHTVEKYLKVLEPLGISTNHAEPTIHLSMEERSWAENFLNSKFTNHQLPITNLVGMVPGARWATKRWNPSGFAALGDRLAKELKARVILLGDSQDIEVARMVAESMKEEVRNFVGKTTLRELAALLEQCHLVLTNDSGPLHIASALGKPVVVLFGPTVEEFGFTPYGGEQTSLSVTLSKDLPCRPCSLHGSERCPLGHHNCMNLITPDEVFHAAKQILLR